ncbi:MAG: hypothetical protein GWN71_23630, partial [Gammaproteobacteria bacterium]|nr:hypothetical protein [Gemmatimonadota bacterium]NIU76441.1 hypothetical protein [Gammaproteobacteria bacterium]NIY10230.1 hypothetical protein [Gemmatimonadota bacterium]
MVTLVVFGLFFVALVRARRGPPEAARAPGGGTSFVVVGGAVVPAFIVVGLVWFTLDRGRA